jgi:hypothetical protein
MPMSCVPGMFLQSGSFSGVSCALTFAYYTIKASMAIGVKAQVITRKNPVIKKQIEQQRNFFHLVIFSALSVSISESICYCILFFIIPLKDEPLIDFFSTK